MVGKRYQIVSLAAWENALTFIHHVLVSMVPLRETNLALSNHGGQDEFFIVLFVGKL
jgi:hypothetical protein